MQRVLAAGESLLDLIIRPDRTAIVTPGGSSLNACVSLGRMGFPVWLLSSIGTDEAGDLIYRFLTDNQVHTDYMYRYREGQTALALAFLDENRDARYTFYKNYPSRLFEALPAFTSHDLFLFGSSYAISRETRPFVKALLGEARKAGSLIVYDPNYRAAHDHEKKERMPVILENLAMADMVRGSEEDFHRLFGTVSAEESYQALPNRETILVYTTATRGVSLVSRERVDLFPTLSIEPVSTIGAGDTFNAGLLFYLVTHLEGREDLKQAGQALWDKAIPFAIRCAASVCLSDDNYLDRGEAGALAREGRA